MKYSIELQEVGLWCWCCYEEKYVLYKNWYNIYWSSDIQDLLMKIITDNNIELELGKIDFK